MSKHSRLTKAGRFFWGTAAAVVTLALSSLGDPLLVYAHNLQTRMVYMFFDPDTQACLDARIANTALPAGCTALPAGWKAGDQLLQVGDQIGIIVKVVPRDGTTTGVGGHVDFYVPNGVQVVDAAYLLPGDSIADGVTGYDKVSMKGQSLIAVGDGPVGAKATAQLIGLGPVGPNVNGVTESPVVFATGLHRGTIAGVYGDTGIFYSTDPDTAYGSWQKFTGDWNAANPGANHCGSAALAALQGITLTGKTITNNSGDVVVPCNKWDAGQLFAWGVRGTSCMLPGCQATPIVDYGDGRGNAPWGFASGVAGPQSGYAWNFDWNEWRASAKTAADMRAAMSNDSIGPWKRIRYPGSRVSYDQAGLIDTALGIASRDASSLGIAAGTLPATVSQTDTTSPKTLRWAVGQLTMNVPEYAWVKLRITNPAALLDPDGCPRFHGDTFGGDAGGDNSGKDHLWRYYEPSRVTVNACAMSGKPTGGASVTAGQTFQYQVKTYNLGALPLTNVVVKDTLPSGVSFTSAFPAQSSGPNPLVWSPGTLLPGQSFQSLVTVKATGSGLIENTMCVTSDQFPNPACTTESTPTTQPILKQTKTVSATSVAPGANVQYAITIENIGGGASGNPVRIEEHLEPGIAYVSKDSVTVNGANYTALTTYAAGADGPTFTVPAAINAGQKLILKFTASVSATAAAGVYCNSFTSWQNGLPLTTGSQACFSIGGAKIGDTIYRDWNGNGQQDAVDEGVVGVTVTLQSCNATFTTCTNAQTTVTNANGNYLFEGLTAGNYRVVVSAGAGTPVAGYLPTGDPDGGTASQANIVLADGEQNLQQDFGYKPVGTGSIGDAVWADTGTPGGTAGDGTQSGGELGIANVTVYLYEDTNGNGLVDPDDALVATQVTNGSGAYSFTGLALGLDYVVQVDQSDADIASTIGGGGVVTASTPVTYAVELTTDAPSATEADFGFYRILPATIGDTVFQDGNGNGVYDGTPTDTPLANVDVVLFQDSNGNGIVDPGEPQVATTSTNGSGVYQFTSVPPGSYVVVVNGQDPDVPSGLSPAVRQLAVTVASGDAADTIDFPFTQLLTKAVKNITTGQDPGNNAGAGNVLEYTLTPSYTGGQMLTDFTVSDAIPNGTTYVGDSDTPEATSEPSGGATTGTVTWSLGSNSASVPGVQLMCPASQTVEATKDTYLSSADFDANFGSATTIAVRSNNIFHGLVQFSLPTLPAGSIFQRADLLMTVENGQGANRTASVRKLLKGPWTEGTSNNTCTTGAAWQGPNCTDDWLSAGGNFGTTDYSATVLGTISPAVDEATYATPVTSAVSDWYGAPSTNYGFALIATGSDTNTVTFHSRTATDAAKRPRLTIKYLEPSATGACAVQTDGVVVYDNNNATPVYKNFGGTTNTFAGAANAATLGNKAKVLVMASSPTKDERILVAVTDVATNNVAGEIWDGSAWAVIPNPPAKDAAGTLGQASITTTYSAAVAYEQASGRAMVVWDDNTQAAGSKLRFSVWDGTTWTAAASIAAYTGGEPVYMRLAAQPGGNGMVLVVNDAVYDSYALVWDGATWANPVALDTGSVAANLGALHVAYEAASGRAVVVYGKDSDRSVSYRIWNGSTWLAEASVAPPAGINTDVAKGTPQWIVVASDPNSNRIALGALTQDKDVWFGIWNGTSWGSQVAATTGAQTGATPDLSVAFESFSGQALAVYSEGNNVRYRTWAGSGWSAELTGPALPNNGAVLTLNSDPNSDKVMLSALDSGQDVTNALWTGSAWTAKVSQTTASGYAVGQPFAYNWRRDQLAKTATRTTLTVTPTVFTDTGSGTTATVTIIIDSAYPGTLTTVPLSATVTGGVVVGACSRTDAIVLPATLTTGTSLTFTYSCPITASSEYGSATFTSLPTGTGQGVLFKQGASNSVLGTPPLKYRVTVVGNVTPVLNTGSIGTNEQQQVTPNMCYAIAGSTDGTNDTDALFNWSLGDASATVIGTGTLTTRAQSAAWNSGNTAIYTTNRDPGQVATSSDLFGTVNPTTGVFAAYSAVQGGACAGRVACAGNTLNGAAGSFSVLNVVGMSFDPATGELYAVHRRNGVLTDLDVLLKLNPVTGQHVDNAFGAGVDYVAIATGGLSLYDIDDIAFHPTTGELYAIANGTNATAGINDRLVKITKATGAVTDVARLANSAGGNVDNVQGLSFVNAPSGIVLYGSTGTNGTPSTNSSLFQINTGTAVATKISIAPTTYADVESVACEPGEFTGNPIIPSSNSNQVSTMLPSGSIGDLVFWDTSKDGTWQGGEPGIPDAYVFVYRDTNGNGVFDLGFDTQVALAITCGGTTSPQPAYCSGQPAGYYTVAGLPAGTYFVDVYEDSITTDGNRDIVPTSGNVLTRVITCGVSCTDVTDADFGYAEAALVQGAVYFDVNHDGTQQLNGPDGNPATPGDNESGLAGITVTLTGTDNAGNPVSLTTTTDASGNYKFIVAPGNYTVAYNTAQTSPTYPDATTPTSYSFIAEGGEDHAYVYKFGVDNAGRIGDRVWNDAILNGVQDSGESGIAGVTVRLYLDADGSLATTGDQTYVDTAVTNGTGNYQFIGLPNTSGSQVYVVKADTTTLPAGYTATGEGDPGTACASLPSGVCDHQIATTLVGAQTITSADFGYRNTTSFSVAGVVWNDGAGGTSGDGSKQAGESGIPGVTVSLVTVGIIDGYVDVNGDGLISAADDGTYFGFTVTDGVIAAPDNTPIYGMLVKGGRLDVDGNGVLSLSDDLPSTVFATTVTSGTGPTGGTYNFLGVPNGDYRIEVDTDTLPSSAYVETGEGNAPGAACGAACDSAVPVRVNGVAPTQQYFGYREQLGSIAGTVCTGNGDGLCNGGETGAVGVQVFLTYAGPDGILGTADDVVRNTQTDGSGNYSFGNLLPGAYQITKSNPANTTSLADADGGNPSNISVNLAVGASVVDKDFELQPVPGGVGDLVWLDVDRDGVYDIGEPGLANVTLDLARAYTVVQGAIDVNGVGGITTADDGWLRGTRIIDGLLDINGDGAITAADDGTFFGTPVIDGRLDLSRNGSIDLVGTTDSGYVGGDTIATEITDMSGHYLFTSVPPGNYLVLVNESTLPGAPGSLTETAGTTNASGLVAVTAGATNLDVDFGYVGDPTKAIIGNFVWSDANNNGVQDTGEPGIGAVTLRLLDENGVPVDNPYIDGTQDWVATTADDGSYYFFGVPPGRYKVDVTDTGGVLAGYALTVGAQSSTDPSAAITVGAGGTYDKADFGYYNAGLHSVSDKAWYDANRNGVVDPGEAGIGGVTLDLVLDENGDGIVNYTVIAGRIDVNDDGRIDTLDDTAALKTLGGYKIVDGFVDIDNDGVITAADNGTYAGYTVTGGVIDLDASGSVPPDKGSIGDVVWLDANGDGLKGAGESGLSGVTVRLCADAACTSVLATTTTDASGGYRFGGLNAGNYYVNVSSGLPATLTGTTFPTGTTSQITLAAGQNYAAADFGYKPNAGTAAIGDRVWSDIDADGVQDAGEAGINNVTVRLCSNSACGTTFASTTTKPDGSYLFTNVAPGTYTVVVTAPGGYTQTYDLDGTGTANAAIVTVADGDVASTVDFGYRNQTVATGAYGVVGDTLFDDTNGNGVQDAGEPGIAGVTLNLYTDPNKDGNPADGVLVATVASDSSGKYSFSGLPVSLAGTGYVVQAADTAGVLANAKATFDPDEAGVCTVCNHLGSATLYPTGTSTGPTKNTVDFGFYFPDNGTISPEPVIASTITATDGTFSFEGLEDGKYVIAVSDNAGALANLQGTTASAQVGERGVTVAGADIQGAHFGYAGLGPIGDRVWNDADGDGVQDQGELGIGGVTVQLYFDSNNNGVFDAGTDTLLKTTATDAAGSYEFNDLPSGTFFVQVAAPGGYTQSGDPDGCSGVGSCTTPGITKVTLTSSSPSYLQADFGYKSNVNLADVSGTVWNDANRNAVIDAGETGRFAGVTVDLVDGSGNVVATTTTDGNGNYTFPDVPAGNYKVVITDVADVLNGYFISSGLDETPISVGASDLPGVNFGYARQTGTASIGDRIWLDTNNDGAFQPGEPGLSGVTVYLCSTSPCTSGNATATTTTDTDGSYLFSGLPAGNYFVGVDAATVPLNLTGTTYPSGTTGQIPLSDGQAYLNADFAYRPAPGYAVLGDTVWYDATPNGLRDPGEVGIGGVRVTILPPAGAAITTITNPDGSWLAVIPEDATATDYAVFVDKTTLPGGVVTTPTNMGGGDTYVVAVKQGDVRLNLDFGYAGGNPASIGDTVWLDANADGIKDPGEAGLPGVGLELYTTGVDGIAGNADDQFVAYTATDANGEYRFTGLLAGEYYVRMVGVPAGLTGTNGNATGGKTGEITLNAGLAYDAADFGYKPATGTAVIGNRVWSDANGNGLQDAGEAGIGGVTVELQNGICTPGVNCPTTVTRADGSYLFTNVPATGTQDYTVVVTPPAGYAAVPTNNGGSTSYTLTNLTSGQIVDTADWGFDDDGTPSASGSIGDRVYNDVNGDGDDESGADPGLSGVTVKLFAAGLDGVVGTADDVAVATTTTDATGAYSFTGLSPGNYRVAVTDVGAVLAGKTATQKAAASIAIACDASSCTTYVTADFGYTTATTGSGSIGDLVWFDKNGDGSVQVDEPGISGVTVDLVNCGLGTCSDGDETVVSTQTTNATGGYDFTGLPAGTYKVVVTDINQVLSNLLPSASPAPVPITCGTPSTCTDYNGADFGYKPTVGTVGNIGGTIWRDTETPFGVTGTLQSGEPGISGVKVELWLDDGDGIIEPGIDNLVRTATTDANGDYNFLGLPPARYIVRVPDDGTVDAAGNLGTNGVLGGMQRISGPNPIVDSNGHVNPYAVNLMSGITDTSVDFAYIAPVPYDISGKVFEDAGGDGGSFQSGTDAVVPGATVILYRVVGGVQYLVDAAVTDGSGNYSFLDLPAGQYVVKVGTTGTIADGFEQTVDPDSTLDSQTTITLGSDVSGINFAYWNGGVVTTPVTLSYFEAQAGKKAGEVQFTWATSTEAGNVGFDLYVVTPTGDLRLINDKLIPARDGLPAEIRQYSLSARGIEGTRFYIVDIDVLGEATRHGPYELGQVHGVKDPVRALIDHKAIKQEHDAKAQKQDERKKEKVKEKLKKLKENPDIFGP